MKTNTTKLSIVMNGGWGNPNQTKLINPSAGLYVPNYDKFVVNVNNESNNFILFLRPRQYFQNIGEVPGLNNEDIVHISEFIHGIALQKYWEYPGDEIDLFLVEVDSPLPEIEATFKTLPVITDADRFAVTPMTRMWYNTVRECTFHQRYSTPELLIIFREFTPEECHIHFFPTCDKWQSEECCKRQKNHNQQ